MRDYEIKNYLVHLVRLWDQKISVHQMIISVYFNLSRDCKPLQKMKVDSEHIMRRQCI